MTRLVVALAVLSSLAACSNASQTRASSAPAPAGSGRTTVVTPTPDTVPASTKDTLQGVGRPSG